MVNITDVKTFLDRDWALIHRAKSDLQVAQKAVMTPSDGIRMGHQLYLFARAMKPDWPNPAERDADLTSHVRVSELLQHASRVIPR